MVVTISGQFDLTEITNSFDNFMPAPTLSLKKTDTSALITKYRGITEPKILNTNPADDGSALIAMIYPFLSQSENDFSAKIIAAALTSGRKPIIGERMYKENIPVFNYGIEIINYAENNYFIVWAFSNGKSAPDFIEGINDIMTRIGVITDNEFLEAKANFMAIADRHFVENPVQILGDAKTAYDRSAYVNTIQNIRRSDIVFYPLASVVILGGSR
jgi:hypothetical protein